MEWIKCSDRLPELANDIHSNSVLVFTGRFIRVGWLIDINGCVGTPEYEWWNGLGPLINVTHWMPLPEPPKE